jgi:hypothetical protein
MPQWASVQASPRLHSLRLLPIVVAGHLRGMARACTCPPAPPCTFGPPGPSRSLSIHDHQHIGPESGPDDQAPARPSPGPPQCQWGLTAAAT